eukprot:jgi/Chrzof1/4927/Cz15g04230.t1
MCCLSFCFELTAQLKYLWPNLRLNSKSNPLFRTIQIDLYDPLRIQHESLPEHRPRLYDERLGQFCRVDNCGECKANCIPTSQAPPPNESICPDGSTPVNCFADPCNFKNCPGNQSCVSSKVGWQHCHPQRQRDHHWRPNSYQQA